MPASREEHTVKRFDQEMERLRRYVMEMGGLVESQIRQAVTALFEEDLGLAREIIDRDHQVNALEVRIDELITDIIARRQPMASDLRTVMMLSKTVTDLERIGDEAERIARTALRIYSENSASPQGRLLRDVQTMANLAGAMLHDCLDALVRQDVEKAAAITHRDADLDDVFGDALRRLVTYMMEDPRTIGQATNVMFMIKGLERIGDHAKNIAEYVIFMVKGRDIRHLDMSAISSDLLHNDPPTPAS